MKIKERGIIFNGEMVRAILDGRKMQTRRMLSPRQLKMIDAASSIGECYPLDCGIQDGNSQSYYREWCPFGKLGDRLYVRETWSDVNYEDYAALAYRADGELKGLNEDDGHDSDPNFEKYQFANWYLGLIEGAEGRWRPSIHMPRWASRITLEITDIRVERLQDISEQDAKAEGAPTECCVIGDKHFLGFRSLWKSIYGQDSWQSNPWVWVVEFKVIHK